MSSASNSDGRRFKRRRSRLSNDASSADELPGDVSTDSEPEGSSSRNLTLRSHDLSAMTMSEILAFSDQAAREAMAQDGGEPSIPRPGQPGRATARVRRRAQQLDESEGRGRLLFREVDGAGPSASTSAAAARARTSPEASTSAGIAAPPRSSRAASSDFELSSVGSPAVVRARASSRLLTVDLTDNSPVSTDDEDEVQIDSSRSTAISQPATAAINRRHQQEGSYLLEGIDVNEFDRPFSEDDPKPAQNKGKGKRSSPNGAGASGAGGPKADLGGSLFSDVTCPICFGAPTLLAVTSCGHLFCAECLHDALSAGHATLTPPPPETTAGVALESLGYAAGVPTLAIYGPGGASSRGRGGAGRNGLIYGPGAQRGTGAVSRGGLRGGFGSAGPGHTLGGSSSNNTGGGGGSTSTSVGAQDDSLNARCPVCRTVLRGGWGRSIRGLTLRMRKKRELSDEES